MPELSAFCAPVLTSVRVSVLQKEEMKRVMEQETWGFSIRPTEEYESERWKTKRAEKRRGGRMRKLTEGDGGS